MLHLFIFIFYFIFFNRFYFVGISHLTMKRKKQKKVTETTRVTQKDATQSNQTIKANPIPILDLENNVFDRNENMTPQTSKKNNSGK